MMHEREKSDPAIVAVKPTNKAERSAAEPVERRAGANGNADQHNTCRAQYRVSVSQALERIRQVRRHSLEVGAVCGKAARTVLCGGRSAMGVPTAIVASLLAMTGSVAATRSLQSFFSILNTPLAIAIQRSLAVTSVVVKIRLRVERTTRGLDNKISPILPLSTK